MKPTFKASLVAAASKIGNGAVVALWCFGVPLTIFLLAVTPILVARQDAALRRQLLETRPTPFPPPPMDPAGQPVLLAGEIDVLTPVSPEGLGLALFERETKRTNGSWLLDLNVKPPFELVLDNGSVRIENGAAGRTRAWSVISLFFATSLASPKTATESAEPHHAT